MVKEKDFQILKNLDEKKFKSYCQFFSKNNLEEFYINENGIEISLKTKKKKEVNLEATVDQGSKKVIQPTSSNQTEGKVILEKVEDESDDGLISIPSPISGTFYQSSSPGSLAFVQEGDKIKKGQKICIIEAMKVMNEITSLANGIVHKILVKNQENVKEGQVIMLLK